MYAEALKVDMLKCDVKELWAYGFCKEVYEVGSG